MLGARVMRAQTIYVLSCEYGSGVNAFAPDGTVLKKLIPLGGAACTGMAVDKAGRFYVGIGGDHNNVRIFDPDGKQIGAWSLGIGVNGLATGPDGKIYVAGGSMIKSFNPDGSPGGLVINRGFEGAATGIAVDSAGNIYVASIAGVSRYDSSGKPIGKMFRVPHDYPGCIGVGPDGKYYSGWEVPVATFLPSGVQTQPTMKVPLVGVRPRPTAITVGKDGKIYVGYYTIGFGKAMVAVFEPDGKMAGKAFATGGGVRGIAVR
jgi:sugar lactone lactonase YvrE